MTASATALLRVIVFSVVKLRVARMSSTPRLCLSHPLSLSLACHPCSLNDAEGFDDVSTEVGHTLEVYTAGKTQRWRLTCAG